MLFAAGVPDKEAMAKSPHVGIASVWWEGNPCNMHLMDLGKTAKKAVVEKGMIGWQYNTIGVSDAITMGSDGMSGGRRQRGINTLGSRCKLTLQLRYAILSADS
jgi:dihydroxy-acid dehydratase